MLGACDELWQLWTSPSGGEYRVSNHGVVQRKAKNVWKPTGLSATAGGYFHIGGCKQGKRWNEYVHRLVAKLFIPNTNSLREVDHKDRDKSNNHVSNLRWASRKQNAENKMGLGYYLVKKTGKWAAQIKTNGKSEHLGTFDSEKDARACYVAAKKARHPFCSG